MGNIITIDGLTSSGKSSIGLIFASKIGYQLIDTGAIYRAATLYAIENNLSVNDSSKVALALTNMNLLFKTINHEHKVFIKDRDITQDIHTIQVSNLTPVFGAEKIIREAAKKIQIKLAKTQNTVMMGRDIGSEIFPDAKLKFVITATNKVRARRRYEQLLHRGVDTTYEKVLKDLKIRDDLDTKRAISPFRIPKDAIIIDTSTKTIEQSVKLLLDYFKQKFP